MNSKFFIQAVSISMVTALHAFANADPLDIHRNDGVKIVFESDIRSDYNQPGDRVIVKVDKDPGLPKETTLEGRITRIHDATRYRAASVDMIFDTLRLPDGKRFRIDAVPTPANDPHLTRGVNGRLVAAYKPGEEGAYVLGGTVGGLILGGIGHRPILGAFVGTIIGAIAGANNREANSNLVVRKGEKMVAVFDQDVSVTSASAAPVPASGWRHREGAYSHPPATSGSPVSAAQTFDIKVDGQVLKFQDAKPYQVDSVVMVPVETVADQLNLATTIHDNGSLSLDGPDTSIQLFQESTVVKGGNSQRPLAHKVENRNGVVYVPLEVFQRLSSVQVTVNGTNLGA